MVHPRRTSDEKRPGLDRQRINPREFATTGPRTPETAANYLLHRGLRQDGGGDQRGVSRISSGFLSRSVAQPVGELRAFRNGSSGFDGSSLWVRWLVERRKWPMGRRISRGSRHDEYSCL